MGFNFRKSFKIGKNFRINMSKSGIGYSVGGKGFRFTHSANGRKTVSSRVPGTGIAYSKSVSPKKHKTPKQTAHAGNMVARKPKSRGVALLLCILFGYFGIHRFYVGKIGTGILYACSAGAFLIGWFADIISISRGRFTDRFGIPLR